MSILCKNMWGCSSSDREQLGGHLSQVADHVLDRNALSVILNLVQIHGSLIGSEQEHIDRFNGIGTLKEEQNQSWKQYKATTATHTRCL